MVSPMYHINNSTTVKSSNKRVVCFTMLLALLCASSKFCQTTGVLISFAEMIALLYQFFVKRSLYGYLTTYITVVITCMDIPVFAYGLGRNLYSFYNMPLIRGYHTILFACLPLLTVFSPGGFRLFKQKLRKYNALRKSFYFLTGMYIWGVVSFAFSFAINDYSFLNKIVFFSRIWRKNFLNYTLVFALILAFSYLLVTKEEDVVSIKNYLYDSLAGVAYAAIISFLLNWKGDYSEGTTLLLTQATFFVIFLVLFPYYEDKSWIKCTLLTGITILVMMRKASGFAGKWYLTVGLVFAVWVLQTMIIKRTVSMKRIIFVFMGDAVALISILIFLKIINGDSFGGLASTKLMQASMLFKGIGSKGWYKALPASPKVRIDEFVNVLIEFMNKPYYFILGKGFSGAIKHYTTATNWNLVGSTFSKNEISNRLYAFMHETPMTLFLMSGLIGMLFIMNEVWFAVKNWKKSVWIIIGIVWFMFFFNAGGYASVYFGLFAWVVGKIDCARDSGLRNGNDEMCSIFKKKKR